MGFIDAFVYAHHQHRRSIENSGNFGDCIKGRIRFMTAITPAYAHAYQATCLTRHVPAGPRLNFRLQHLPNVRTTTRERGNDFQGWAICTDGGTRVVDGGASQLPIPWNQVVPQVKQRKARLRVSHGESSAGTVISRAG